MSLEAALNDHAAVLREFIAKFNAAAMPTNPPKAAPEKPAAQPVTRGRASSDDKQVVPPVTATPAPAAQPAAKAHAYEDVAKAVLALVQGKGREVALELLGGFENKDKPGEKAVHGKQLKESDYAAFLALAAKASVA